MHLEIYLFQGTISEAVEFQEGKLEITEEKQFLVLAFSNKIPIAGKLGRMG